MNERIKELAIEAGMIVGEANGFDMTRLMPKEVKFAELIVKDCLKQIDKMRDGFEADNEDQQALGAEWAGLAVARYFGVE